MNKMNMLVLAGLMFFSANSCFAMGKQEREILYTLHELGQNIADVPMITQNIDMFIGVLEMNIQITEAKFAAANQKFKTVLCNSAALFAGCVVGKQLFAKSIDYINYNVISYKVSGLASFKLIRDVLATGVFTATAIAGNTLIALNIHDAWKNRSALDESLTLDRQLLWQLIEIKDSMDQDTESAENFLLKSAE